MSKTDDGGPAFPATVVKADAAGYARSRQMPGMTLRDWFAGQALAGMLANAELGDSTNKVLAGDAYDLADALLAERQRGET